MWSQARDWDPQKIDAFWNEYLVAPWNNWSIGEFGCMLSTPSQQPQEAWHREIFRTLIPGHLKGSINSVLQIALPRLIQADSERIPDELCFHVHPPRHTQIPLPTPCTTLICGASSVQVPMVPKGCYQKALWYVQKVQTHMARSPRYEGRFYVLRKGSDIRIEHISTGLIRAWERAAQGES